MEFTAWLQERLLAHGYNPGIVDGLWGRDTRNALIAFQKAKGIPPTGAANEATVALLRQDVAGPGTPETVPDQHRFERFSWMGLALRKKGLHEKTDNFELRAFLKSDGKTLGDPAVLPW